MSDNIPRKQATETVLMTAKLGKSDVSLRAAAQQLKVPVDAIDKVYGLVTIDPDNGLYAVKVRSALAPAAATSPSGKFAGPFSNPRIMAFGRPPRSSEDR